MTRQQSGNGYASQLYLAGRENLPTHLFAPAGWQSSDRCCFLPELRYCASPSRDASSRVCSCNEDTYDQTYGQLNATSSAQARQGISCRRRRLMGSPEGCADKGSCLLLDTSIAEMIAWVQRHSRCLLGCGDQCGRCIGANEMVSPACQLASQVPECQPDTLLSNIKQTQACREAEIGHQVVVTSWCTTSRSDLWLCM